VFCPNVRAGKGAFFKRLLGAGSRNEEVEDDALIQLSLSHHKNFNLI
jgi:hypothetical protein